MSKLNNAVYLTGVKEIDKKLATLEQKLQKKVLRKAMRTGMKGIQSEIKARMPKDTGATAKGVKVRAAKKQKRGSIGIEVRSQDDNYIAKWLEFGTSKMAARPTFRNVFDEMGDTARQKTEQEILKGIDDITEAK
ncbi:HK97-gp10 family putative phage morphogenesis protein [Thalassoglobus sp.]|uniref:HK97-gp10 family putative phage morphogenesis protein n=1 Tax=Thalassoglobus sp. TaxID=2795869 RepID=UPI003AA94623